MNRDIVQIINGFKFYIEILDFQGDNKKFYINYHNDLKSFDLFINKEWFYSVEICEAMRILKRVLDNPIRTTKGTIRDIKRIKLKINYYKNKSLENECKKKIESIDEIEDKIIERFKRLNTRGKANLLEHLDTLLGTNKYIVNN